MGRRIVRGGDDGLKRYHQQYHAHRSRGQGDRAHAACAAALCQAHSYKQADLPPSFLLCTQRARARSHARTAHCAPHARTAPRESRSAHALPHRPQPHDSSTRTHAALRAARTAPALLAPPPVAAPPAAGSRHHARTTTRDDENMLSAHTGANPETPIDGVRRHWSLAPAMPPPPCSSHASVAHTATRSSSRGPASALRFNYYKYPLGAPWCVNA